MKITYSANSSGATSADTNLNFGLIEWLLALGMALSKALAWRSAQQRHSAGSHVYSHTYKLETAARGTKAAAGGGLAALAPSGSLSGSSALGGNTSSGRSPPAALV